jgi:hypothetical protein
MTLLPISCLLLEWPNQPNQWLFFGGEILPNFDLKIMNPFLYKGFSMEKMAQSHQILKKKVFLIYQVSKNKFFPNCQIFFDKFQ